MAKNDTSAEVKAVFDEFTTGQRKTALALRDEIVATVGAHPEIGELEETLKWGVPSYLPAKSNVGSTIRISLRKETGEIALFFICTSGLMDEFREIYPDTFDYHGDRAVTLRGDIKDVRGALRHIIALALTMKLRRRRAA